MKLKWRVRSASMARAARAWACVGSVLLAACGGGGGGGSAAGGDGGGGTPPAVVSGLLPAASAPGATLYDDASPFRPLRDKSVYTYRGQHSVQGGTEAPRYYDNTVTQVAQATGVREDATNVFDEGPNTSSEPVALQSGAIHQQVTLDLFGGAAPLRVDYVELKSPLRVNDRYVVTDTRIADAGADFDGDRRNDGLDLAVWVQVMGEETLNLPNRTGLRVIHTLATVRVRAVLTTGGLGPVVESRLGVWYASGIGPVKVQRDNPHPSVDGVRLIDEETLVTYDGISSGLGYTTKPVMGLVPASASEPATAIPYPYGAVAFDANVVTISDLPNGVPDAGFTLTQLDARGAVVAATPYANTTTGGSATGHTLLRLGSELRLLYVGSDGVYMHRFSEDGQTRLSSAPVKLVNWPLASLPVQSGGGGQFFRAVSSGGSLWVLTQTAYDSSSVDQTRLELRRFGTDGKLVGTPRLIESGVDATRVNALSLVATDTRLLLLWRMGSDATALNGHLLIDGSTGVAVPAATADVYASLGPCALEGTPVLTDTASLVSCLANQQPTVVTLQANGQVLGTAGGVRADGLAPADVVMDQGGFSWLNNRESDPQKLAFYGPRFGIVNAGDAQETAYLEFAEVPLSSGIPDKTGYRLLARAQGSLASTSFAFSFGNRILLVGGDCNCQGGKLGTMVVWR